MNIRKFIADNASAPEHFQNQITETPRQRANRLSVLLHDIYEINSIIEPEAKGNRMILYSDRNSLSCKFNEFREAHQSIIRECNGIIIDICTLDLICSPQKGFMYVYGRDSEKINVVTKFYYSNLYTIHKINDGTTLNLYWWETKWVLSTFRGIEVNAIIWLGYNTYQEVLEEVLVNYDEFSWENLNKNRTYTIGFYHPHYHPFQALKNKKKAWFIQSMNNTTGQILLDESIGIPCQESIKQISLNELYIKCNNEMLQYKKFRTHTKYSTLIDEVHNQIEYEPWFGFILKSIDENVTGNYSHVIYESSLYINIKKLIYNNKHTKNIRRNNYDRDSYLVLRSYLDTNIHDKESLFLILFPQYTCIYEQYHKVLLKVANSLMLCMAYMSYDNAKKVLSKSPHLLDKLTLLLLDSVAEYFYGRNFAAKEDIKIEILKYIIDEKYLGYYYPLFAREHKKILDKMQSDLTSFSS